MTRATSAAETACPFCATPTRDVWGERAGHVIYACPSCGVVFFDRAALESSDYHHYYDYAANWDEKRVLFEARLRERQSRAHLAALRRHLGKTETKKPALLEVGAGPGYFCAAAARAGYDVWAVEPNPTSVGLGARHFGLRYARLEDAPDGTFDAAAAFHVLEHVFEPASFLRALRAKLRPGGVLAVVVPHREPPSFAVRNALRRSGAGEKLCALYAPEHVSGFTRKSLTRAVEPFGFRALSVRPASLWSAAYDPFFLKNFVDTKNCAGIAKKALRGAFDAAGAPFGAGDWIVAYFRAV